MYYIFGNNNWLLQITAMPFEHDGICYVYSYVKHNIEFDQDIFRMLNTLRRLS